MTPRKASLRVAHQAHCPNAAKTALDSVDAACRASKCSPSYYTFNRDSSGAVKKGPRLKDRREAEKELRALQVKIDQGRLQHAERPEQNLPFPEWAREFEQQLEQRVRAGDLAGRSKDAYMDTVNRAVDAIGYVNVRDLGAPDLRRFYETLTGLTPAGRLRHLRHLNLCLAAAVDDGYAAANPLPLFKKKLRLRAPKSGKAPFEAGELERLWTAYPELGIDPVYLHIAKLAAEMGGRLGEMVGLDWTAVTYNAQADRYRIEILQQYNDMEGLKPPKSHDARTVYLTPEAKAALEAWMRVSGGGPGDDGPAFPNPDTGGRLVPRSVQRNLTRAMAKAGIPRTHPELRLPRSFHSLRYSTSVLMQLRGYHPRLIEQTLGHSTLQLTYGVYGGWTPQQLEEEANRAAV